MGYVLKQSGAAQLLQAVRAAARKQPYLDADVAVRAAGAYFSQRVRHRDAPPQITDRETEVLRLMALGHANREIAAALDISVKTVEVHKTNSMRKLGLRGRIDVIRYAVLQGWLQDA